MNIQDFFQQSAGKWFAHRSSQHLDSGKSQSSKSEILMDFLTADDPAVVQLCQQQGVNAAQALCGVKIRWKDTMELNRSKQEGSTVLVPLADANAPHQGQLLRSTAPGQAAIVSRYVMGTDEALTLISEHDAIYSEERMWFAGPNLRLRSTILKHPGGFSLTSFCSEIRMNVPAS